MFETSLTTNFLDKMKKISEGWSSSLSISFTIFVPPELAWWYYQEYGINHPYEISGPNGVAFTGDFGVIIRPNITHPENYVTHPGLQPTHTVGVVNESIMNGLLQAAVREAFLESNYEVTGVTTYLENYMQAIKQEIVEQMAIDLPGTRPPDPQFPIQSGKLRGRTAAEVFNENAVIRQDI